jgi:hypothetical protein
VAHAQALHVPMKLGRELVVVIGADCVQANWEPGNHMIDEINGIGLGVALIYLQGPNTGGIVRSDVLGAGPRSFRHETAAEYIRG